MFLYPKEYSNMTVNFIPEQVRDIYRYCVLCICIDTTFEISDGLYLTDITHPNLSFA